MGRALIKNACVVTVNDKREVWPSGFIAVSDRRIEAVGPASMMPSDDDFDEVIDAASMLAMPSLINMHQHHWYTLFKGLADGYLLEDWVTDVLLPLALTLDERAMRVSSYLAGMEMLA